MAATTAAVLFWHPPIFPSDRVCHCFVWGRERERMFGAVWLAALCTQHPHCLHVSLAMAVPSSSLELKEAESPHRFFVCRSAICLFVCLHLPAMPALPLFSPLIPAIRDNVDVLWCWRSKWAFCLSGWCFCVFMFNPAKCMNATVPAWCWFDVWVVACCTSLGNYKEDWKVMQRK